MIGTLIAREAMRRTIGPAVSQVSRESLLRQMCESLRCHDGRGGGRYVLTNGGQPVIDRLHEIAPGVAVWSTIAGLSRCTDHVKGYSYSEYAFVVETEQEFRDLLASISPNFTWTTPPVFIAAPADVLSGLHGKEFDSYERYYLFRLTPVLIDGSGTIGTFTLIRGKRAAR